MLSVEGECCDVCDEEVKHLRDCHKELEVAVDAIEAIGSKGEVKLLYMQSLKWTPLGSNIFSPYSEVSLSQGLPVYFLWACYCIIGLLSTTCLCFQSISLLCTGGEG